MKRKFAVIVAITMLFSVLALSAEINFEISTDNRVYMDRPINDPDYGFNFNENALLLKAYHQTDNVKGYAELEFLSRGLPSAVRLSDSYSYEKLQPWEIKTNEAYISFRNIFTEGFDFTAGRQIIMWGTADKLNQISFVNPYDFSDLLDFGKRLGVNSTRAVYNAGNLALELVYVPVFTASLMSPEIDPMRFVPAGFTPFDAVETKPATAANSSYAGRLGYKLSGFDVHAVYYYGLYNIPVIATDVNVDMITPAKSVTITEKYPFVNAAGIDFAGSVAGTGVWGELAAIVPNRRIEQGKYIVTPLGTLEEKKILIDEKPYFKYTLGCDYTFADGTYVNAQFMHGFFTELCDNMTNIAIARAEKGFADDTVKIKIEGGLEFEMNASKNVTPGALLMPGITFVPFDASEMEFTGLKVFNNNKNAGGGKLVSVFEGLDQIIFRVRYTF